MDPAERIQLSTNASPHALIQRRWQPGPHWCLKGGAGAATPHCWWGCAA